MLLSGQKALLLVMALSISSDWLPLGVSGQRGAGDDVPETFTDDPNLVNDPSTDDTALADITPSTDELGTQLVTKILLQSAGMRSLRVQDCTLSIGQSDSVCTRPASPGLRRMYIINNEICSRLVCKEHEAMKGSRTSPSAAAVRVTTTDRDTFDSSPQFCTHWGYELCRQMAGLPPRGDSAAPTTSDFLPVKI
ncbi:Microfibrillar-associated protein 5 [Apodemus speciosus]|uniref:Microfibrillar-associated protein 5 n=1 Tax=Apodemus speciosus TaxID=105296 RepID=A0ABQ0EWF6_APOSI